MAIVRIPSIRYNGKVYPAFKFKPTSKGYYYSNGIEQFLISYNAIPKSDSDVLYDTETDNVIIPPKVTFTQKQNFKIADVVLYSGTIYTIKEVTTTPYYRGIIESKYCAQQYTSNLYDCSVPQNYHIKYPLIDVTVDIINYTLSPIYKTSELTVSAEGLSSDADKQAEAFLKFIKNNIS